MQKLQDAFHRISPRILEFIRSNARPIDKDAILRSVTGRRQYVIYCLKALVESGNIKVFGSGVRSDPFLYSTNHSTSKASSDFKYLSSMQKQDADILEITI